MYFYFKKFKFDSNLKKQRKGQHVPSSLKHFADLKHSYVTMALHFDYQDVGKHSFLPRLLPGL